MKSLKHLLLTIIFTVGLSNANAQFYAKVSYWGTLIDLDQSFFEILNANYSNFVNNTARTWKYYDYQDYQSIYIDMVDNLKRLNFVITVNEANQLSWTSSYSPYMPGASDDTERRKKSQIRATWMLHQVLLPSLQTFAKAKR